SSTPRPCGACDAHQRTSRISKPGSAAGSQPGQYIRASDGVSVIWSMPRRYGKACAGWKWLEVQRFTPRGLPYLVGSPGIPSSACLGKRRILPVLAAQCVTVGRSRESPHDARHLLAEVKPLSAPWEYQDPLEPVLAAQVDAATLMTHVRTIGAWERESGS